jgi:hypothetical protein
MRRLFEGARTASPTGSEDARRFPSAYNPHAAVGEFPRPEAEMLSRLDRHERERGTRPIPPAAFRAQRPPRLMPPVSASTVPTGCVRS